jgi:IclR family transcriptional regulator, KDG regulon repressor
MVREASKSGGANPAVKGSQYHVQVLDRALGILEVLSSEGPELALGELVERSGLHKSTVHRLLMVLEQHRFIERKNQNGKYSLGLKLFELGSQALAQLGLTERAKPNLERLVFETGETANLCVLDEGEVLYLEKKEAPRTVRIPAIVGRRYPPHCGAAGKTLLAFLPEDQLDELIKRQGLKAYTKNTITTPAQLKAELQLIRDRGYALDNEEFEEGLKCIGAPVMDYSGSVIASIGIAGLAFRLTDEKIPALAVLVKGVARDLSTELGNRDTPLNPADRLSP